MQRFFFEGVVRLCVAEGLVKGEGFAVDASVIKADAHHARGFPGSDGIVWERPGRKTRAVCEYLAALDNNPKQVKSHEATRKAISLTDPGSCWTAGPNGPAFYGYSTNYLVDVAASVIADVEASPATLSKEAQAARTMTGRTERCFDIRPQYLAGNTAYGNAQMLGWLVDDMAITPYVPVRHESDGSEGQFGHSYFTWDKQAGHYTCPGASISSAAPDLTPAEPTEWVKTTPLAIAHPRATATRAPLNLGAVRAGPLWLDKDLGLISGIF